MIVRGLLDVFIFYRELDDPETEGKFFVADAEKIFKKEIVYACEGLLSIGLAMGGRYIRNEALAALEGQTDGAVTQAFDEFADQINQLNREEEEEAEAMAGGSEARGVHV